MEEESKRGNSGSLVYALFLLSFASLLGAVLIVATTRWPAAGAICTLMGVVCAIGGFVASD